MARDPRVSFATNPAVRRRMQSQRTESTGPEVALRRELHRLGLRYRLHVPVLEGRTRKPDVVFRPWRVAVFVDGCFWHACRWHGTQPKVNCWYWEAKLVRNRERDRDTDKRLRAMGWRVVRVWEHEQPTEAAERIARWVRERRADAARAPASRRASRTRA